MELTAGIIGCGNISRFHLAAMHRAGVRLKWACDVVRSAAQERAIEFNANAATDYRAILADPEVDFVTVTTPSAMHKRICIDAIEAGKAVICEKTLAENADDSLEIVSLAQDRGVVLFTSYMKRFIPAVRKAHELLPQLGKILSTHIRTYQPWGDLWHGVPQDGFFSVPAGGISLVKRNYGGGILYCGGSHLLDLICFFLGRPTCVFASIVTPEGFDYELHASALMETHNGAVHLDALAHPLEKAGYLEDGWDERLEIVGTDGRLEILIPMWDQPEVKASRVIHHGKASGGKIEYDFDPVSPFDAAIRFFCENIALHQQGNQSIATGYEVDELIAYMLQSARERCALEIRWRI